MNYKKTFYIHIHIFVWYTHLQITSFLLYYKNIMNKILLVSHKADNKNFEFFLQSGQLNKNLVMKSVEIVFCPVQNLDCPPHDLFTWE